MGQRHQIPNLAQHVPGVAYAVFHSEALRSE